MSQQFLLPPTGFAALQISTAVQEYRQAMPCLFEGGFGTGKAAGSSLGCTSKDQPVQEAALVICATFSGPPQLCSFHCTQEWTSRECPCHWGRMSIVLLSA